VSRFLATILDTRSDTRIMKSMAGRESDAPAG